ncbi:hypothetical protein [Streptomyces sp. BPTC-684]|uniref:hypothetical protein n=1 Tax=Streptomyces sp. BPTC-684 TaxID=3043734 RepID=UPI0024B083C7|nr:hypothetical protein [Streptomyces sp. BPTC-684]WHM37433.1 hypothetical protein QIY60_11305 [Streptomyces sp. BPTC-684]
MSTPAIAAPPPDGTKVTCGRGVSWPGLGLYYHSNNTGSKRCIFGSVDNYDVDLTNCSSRGCARYYFEADGRDGQNKPVKNAAASAYNYSDYVVRVYFKSGWGGTWDSFPYYGYQGSAKWYGNLNATYNENASQQMVLGG